MSGADAIAILGLISSINTIVDSVKRVYEAASSAQGLPEAFCEVHARLPIIQNILRSAKQQIEAGKADDDSCKGARKVIENCLKKTEEVGRALSKSNSCGWCLESREISFGSQKFGQRKSSGEFDETNA